MIPCTVARKTLITSQHVQASPYSVLRTGLFNKATVIRVNLFFDRGHFLAGWMDVT